MDTDDLTRLREIAARPDETVPEETYAPMSDARMSRIAQTLIKHAEDFNLDGETLDGQPAGLPMSSYISSLITDILHFADLVIPVNIDTTDDIRRVLSAGGARECLQQAISYASDSDTPTYDNLKGLSVL